MTSPDTASETTTTTKGTTDSKEVLIVVSKLKDYIQKTAGMNTSGTVPTVISDAVRALCDAAIARAKADGRKTVMDRDFAA